MSVITFDDGSTIDTATGASTDAQRGMLLGDYWDWQKMQGTTPAPAQQQGMAWWEALAAYGITKAIDNKFAPSGNIAGNTNPGSFAGQNGKTYTNGPGAAAPAGAGGMNWLLLGAAAVAAFFLIRD